MSNNYATIPTIKEGIDDGEDLHLTAFVGGNLGKSIQLTIGKEYCALSEEEVNHLIKALQQRIDGVITATGDEQYTSRPSEI